MPALVDSVVGDAVLRKVVGTDFFSSISGTNSLGTGFFEFLLLFLLFFLPENLA